MSDDTIKKPEQPIHKKEAPNEKVAFEQDSKYSVIEDAKVDHPGKIQLPTYSRIELEKYADTFFQFIEGKQKDRNLYVKSHQDHEFIQFKMDINQDDEESVFVWLTPDELECIESLRTDLSALSQAYNEKEYLNVNETITTMPTYPTGGRAFPLVIMSPDVNKISDPVKKIRAKLGMGVSRTAPLFGSGFRVDMSAATTLELLNLESKIINEKIQISRDTHGYALTSMNVYMDRILIDFIMSHIDETTAGTVDKTELLRLISLTDLDTLILSMAATAYPEGYNLERVIYEESPDKGLVTKRIIKKVNINRMLGVLKSKLTNDEKQRLARYTGRIDHDTIIDHRRNLRKDVDRFIKIDDGLLIKLAIPSLETYLRIGLNWHIGMEERIREVMGDDSDPDTKETYIYRATIISRIMYLAHWVEGFYTPDPEGVEEPQPIEGLVRLDSSKHDSKAVDEVDDAINKILSDITVKPSIANDILDGIETFSNKMRISFVIIPRDKEAKVLPGEHPYVVTVNPAEIFFTQLRHKILMAGG